MVLLYECLSLVKSLVTWVSAESNKPSPTPSGQDFSELPEAAKTTRNTPILTDVEQKETEKKKADNPLNMASRALGAEDATVRFHLKF